VTREVNQLLGRVFAQRRKEARTDLEAVESALRTALHQAGAAALNQLLARKCSDYIKATSIACAMRNSTRKAFAPPLEWSRPAVRSPSVLALSGRVCTGPAVAPMPSSHFVVASSVAGSKTSGSVAQCAELLSFQKFGVHPLTGGSISIQRSNDSESRSPVRGWNQVAPANGLWLAKSGIGGKKPLCMFEASRNQGGLYKAN